MTMMSRKRGTSANASVDDDRRGLYAGRRQGNALASATTMTTEKLKMTTTIGRGNLEETLIDKGTAS